MQKFPIRPTNTALPIGDRYPQPSLARLDDLSDQMLAINQVCATHILLTRTADMAILRLPQCLGTTNNYKQCENKRPSYSRPGGDPDMLDRCHWHRSQPDDYDPDRIGNGARTPRKETVSQLETIDLTADDDGDDPPRLRPAFKSTSRNVARSRPPASMTNLYDAPPARTRRYSDSAMEVDTAPFLKHSQHGDGGLAASLLNLPPDTVRDDILGHSLTSRIHADTLRAAALYSCKRTEVREMLHVVFDLAVAAHGSIACLCNAVGNEALQTKWALSTLAEATQEPANSSSALVDMYVAENRWDEWAANFQASMEQSLREWSTAAYDGLSKMEREIRDSANDESAKFENALLEKDKHAETLEKRIQTLEEAIPHLCAAEKMIGVQVQNDKLQQRVAALEQRVRDSATLAHLHADEEHKVGPLRINTRDDVSYLAQHDARLGTETCPTPTAVAPPTVVTSRPAKPQSCSSLSKPNSGVQPRPTTEISRSQKRIERLWPVEPSWK
jgi:hypothetical protein